MKIGIMGGTFDPIHNGHLMLGEYAYQEFGLDEVWFMPNGNPPHKSNPEIRKMTVHRTIMTKLAIEDIPYFRICTYEADLKETSYSYKTMEHFREIYPEHEFYFIIGADSLFTLQEWKHPERLLPIVIILAAYRDDADTPKKMKHQIEYLNRLYHGDIRLLKTPLMPVSSSDVRRRIKEGTDCGAVVPEKVLAYIQEHHMYQGD